MKPDGTNTSQDDFAAAITKHDFERYGHSLCSLEQAFTNLKHRELRIDLSVHDDLVKNRRRHPHNVNPNHPQYTAVVRHIVRISSRTEEIGCVFDML